MRFIILLLLLTVMALGAKASPEPGLLFNSNFDGFTVKANYAAGNPNCKSRGFANPDLQLRMFPGVQRKGNALLMDNREECNYDMYRNLDPRQGTVSFWISPQNYNMGKDGFQIFFNAQQPDFRLLIYKYGRPCEIDVMIQKGISGKKGTVSTVAGGRITASDWKPGSWHQIVVVWNSQGIKVYFDGKLAPAYTSPKPGESASYPERKFTKEISFPETASQGGVIQLQQLGWHLEQDHKTAFDELKIYNRCLSEAEISESYQKYFPQKVEETPPVLIIPRTSSGISLDGKLDSAEWNDAARVPLLKAYKGANHQYPSDTWMSIKSDKDNLYLGFSTDRPPRRSTISKTDGNVYSDDCFEFHIIDTAKNNLWFCVNSRGVIFDAKNNDRNWNSGITTGAMVQPNGNWSVELKIPLAALGSPAPGTAMIANFWTLNFGNPPHYYWSWYGAPEFTEPLGKIVFSDRPDRVRIERLGNIYGGKLDLMLEAQTPVTARITDLAGNPIHTTEMVTGKPWQLTLPAGYQKLQLEQRGNGKLPAFRYELTYNVNQPLELAFANYPSQQYLEVTVDLNNSGSKALSALEQKKGTGTVELLEPTGKVISKIAFRPTIISKVKLPLKQMPKPGTCQIKAIINIAGKTLKRSMPFRIPNMEPYKLKIADDHDVPDPWTPVKQLQPGVFSVLDRTYRFAKGPFPAQIISRGSELLTVSPELLLNGKPVSWSNFKMAEAFDDYVVLTGHGRTGTVSFVWRGELWFDGLYKLDFSLVPDQITPIDSLTLSWRMPAEFGKYFLGRKTAALHIPWVNNQIKYGLDLRTSLWLTGDEKGFLWQPLTNANWVSGSASPFVLTRDAREITVTCNLIAKPVKLGRKAQYSLAMMGTPARRTPKDFRNFNYAGWGNAPGENYQILNWGGSDDKVQPDDILGWISHIPRDPAAFKKSYAEWRGKKIVPVPYGQPGFLCSFDPEFDYFLKEWIRIPNQTWNCIKDGVSFSTQACCGRMIADLTTYRLNKLMKDVPEMGRHVLRYLWRRGLYEPESRTWRH